jgi:hypothetical protein
MIVRFLRWLVGSTRFFMTFVTILMSIVLKDHPTVYVALCANMIAWIHHETKRQS